MSTPRQDSSAWKRFVLRGTARSAGAYPRSVLLSPELLVVALLVALIALGPVRRLHRLGWPTSWLRTYWIVFVICGIILGEVPSAAKLLVPGLLIAGLLPFVAGGLLGRAARRRDR